jgi:uncharacterized membrane protein YjjP (DUF1212 family)
VPQISRFPRPPRTRVAGRSLPDRAGRAVRDSGAPDDVVALWQGTDGVDQRTARAVIDLAMRVGETLLSTGASASDVVATVLRLIDAYGLGSVHVDVTFTSISVSYHRGPDADPMTVMRGIKVRSTDLTRLERLQTLVRDIAEEPVEIDVARARFDALIKAPHPYRRWVVTASLAGLAVALLAASSAGVPGLQGVSPSLVVASGNCGAARRAVRGRRRSGRDRRLLRHRGCAGLRGPGPDSRHSGWHWSRPGDRPAVQGLDAVHCRHAAIRQHRGPSGGRDGGFGNVRGVGMGPVAASSLAALTAGFLSQVGASRLRVPALALSTAAIVPLLPGLAVYRGLFEIVQRSPGEGLSTGLTTLFGAAGVGMGLAAGVSLGTFLARPLRAELDRGQRRALRRSAGDARE